MNTLHWDGGPGHYEVYYLSATDRASGWGLWIRYTMRSPDAGLGESHLWFMAMHPDGRRIGRKVTLPIEELVAEPDPFRLTIGESVLTDTGMTGGFEDISWNLTWDRGTGYEHVHPFLQKAKIAKTVLVLPHADVAVSGTVRFGATELTLDGARGGQAHLWGSKHALRWAWVHCNDFVEAETKEPRPGSFVDGVSVVVPRFGREIGPSTPIVARVLGEDLLATSPARVTRAPSRFGLTSWHFEVVAGKRKLIGEVDAPRQSLVGVTYHDPDGQKAYCYNSEVASMRLGILDKTARGRFGWVLRETLVAENTAHFEYAQREPVADVELLVT